MVDADGIIVSDLIDDFPNWDVSPTFTDSGRVRNWYGTRNHVLTGAEMDAGLHHSVAANTPLELRALLERQTEIERQIEVAKQRARPPRDETGAWNPAYR